MTPVILSTDIAGLTKLTPLQLNKIRFTVNNTVITPEKLRQAAQQKMQAAAAAVSGQNA